MERLNLNKEFFERLVKDLDNDDVMCDTPMISVEVYYGDGEYEESFIETSQYMEDYCSGAENKINLFTENFHFAYDTSIDEIEISELIYFNTGEYGIPREYARDEIHCGDDLLQITKNTFFYRNEQYSLGSTEEERFQLSCTDIGYFIDVVLRAKQYMLEDISKHGNPEV